MTLDSVQSDAMKLSQEERGKLAAALLASLDDADPADPKEVERMWLDEAERRYQSFLAGRAKLVPAEEVMARMRKAIMP